MRKKLTKQHTALLFSLYTTQFLGLAFFTEALIAILRRNGMPLENLGFVYFLGLFWVLKFLWAPFIDRIEFKRFGHYKAWIIIFQALMVLVLFLSSLFDLFANLEMVISLSVIFAFLSASQSIAVDALVYKSVSSSQRPSANAMKSAGGMVGMVLGSGVGLIIYSSYGWAYTMIALAIATSISLLQIIIYKEEKTKRSKDKNKINYKQYLDFWKGEKRKKWLLLLLVYPLTISMAYGLITPILVDEEWSLDKIGFAVHIVGFGIGVLSAFLASWFISKYGRKNILIISSLGQIIGILLLFMLQSEYNSSFIAMLVVGFIFSFYSPSSVVMTTLMMDEVSSEFPASQFAMQHSIYMFSGIVASGLAVSFAGIFGYPTMIVIGSVIGLLALYSSLNLTSILSSEVNNTSSDEKNVSAKINIQY